MHPENNNATAANLSAAILLLTVIAWAVLYFVFGGGGGGSALWLPGHPAWCAGLLWISAMIGAEAAQWLRLPRMVGMLLAGLVLRNAGAMDGYTLAWSAAVGHAALATIFLRCGVEIEFSVRAFGFACACAFVFGLSVRARARRSSNTLAQKTTTHTRAQKKHTHSRSRCFGRRRCGSSCRRLSPRSAG